MRIDADEIIAGLGGSPSTGMCRCPAHSDKTPSLMVKEASGGKVLVKCFAGCKQDAVIQALRERGLWSTAATTETECAMDERREKYQSFMKGHSMGRAAIQEGNKPPTAYLKARGIDLVPRAAMLLSAKATDRLSGKHFPAMVVPITDGGKLIGTHLTWLTRDTKAKLQLKDGSPRRIYGTAKGGYVICGQADPTKPLIIGEGIETTLSGMQLSGCSSGIAAVSAGNMPSVRPPKCSEVIIAADNDAAGRKAAEGLAERLRYEGVKVRIALPPAESGDWNDCLLDDDTPTATWKNALTADDPAYYEPNNQTRNSIEALDEEEFMELTFAKRQPLLQPWLPGPGLAMISAARGEGKTWLAMAIGKAVANKTDLLGWSCPDFGRVLYIDGELPGGYLQERLRNFQRSPPGMFHLLCRDTFNLKQRLMPDLGTPEGRLELDRIIGKCDPKLIIIDSISTMVRSGVENEAESWAPVQDWLMKHRWQRRTVLLVHHTGRSGQPRGTSKREDVLDTMIGLRKKSEDDASDDSIFELTFTKARDFYGADAEPLQLRLSMPDGKVTWAVEKIRNVREEKIRDMSKSGMSNTEIAKELDLSKARIGQVLKKARTDNNDRVIPFRRADRPAR